MTRIDYSGYAPVTQYGQEPWDAPMTTEDKIREGLAEMFAEPLPGYIVLTPEAYARFLDSLPEDIRLIWEAPLGYNAGPLVIA